MAAKGQEQVLNPGHLPAKSRHHLAEEERLMAHLNPQSPLFRVSFDTEAPSLRFFGIYILLLTSTEIVWG